MEYAERCYFPSGLQLPTLRQRGLRTRLKTRATSVLHCALTRLTLTEITPCVTATNQRRCRALTRSAKVILDFSS